MSRQVSERSRLRWVWGTYLAISAELALFAWQGETSWWQWLRTVGSVLPVPLVATWFYFRDRRATRTP